MTAPLPTDQRLKNRLLRIQGNLGREGAEMVRLASKSKLSVHQLQSIAMGRKGMSAASEKAIARALNSRS